MESIEEPVSQSWSATADASAMPTVVEDVACTACGCVCDDLQIEVTGKDFKVTSGSCSLAEKFYGRVRSAEISAAALIDGQRCEWEQAAGRAAQILANSQSPLVYGLASSSTRGQRAAVKIADRLGGYVDTAASTCHAPSIMAVQAVGESTCSLGEVRNRSDLVLFWGSNPVESHPRHLERYSADPVGQFLPGGRSDRYLVVIDVEKTATAERADLFIQLEPDSDFDVIWALRSLLKEHAIPSTVGGVSEDKLRYLVEKLTSCRYGIAFFGLGLASGRVPHTNVEALLRLVTDLNQFARFCARRMRNYGDVAGADSVLCWTTGFPFSVSLNRGYPRYNPGEYSAGSLLAGREVDCCLLVGGEGLGKLPAAAHDWLQQIPTIYLNRIGESPMFSPTVTFNTSLYGVHEPGTAYRMDEVPVPLRAFLPKQLPSDDEILTVILDNL